MQGQRYRTRMSRIVLQMKNPVRIAIRPGLFLVVEYAVGGMLVGFTSKFAMSDWGFWQEKEKGDPLSVPRTHPATRFARSAQAGLGHHKNNSKSRVSSLHFQT